MKRTISLTASQPCMAVVLTASCQRRGRSAAGGWTLGAHDHRGQQRHQESENLHRRERQDPVPRGWRHAEVKRGGEDTVIIDQRRVHRRFQHSLPGTGEDDLQPAAEGMMPHMGVTIDGKYLGPNCGAEKTLGEAK